MAGDWIKIEENTPDKPEVWAIASKLGIDADAVTGKLIRVWVWATRNCNGDGVTNVTVKQLIDRCANATGFADAMIGAGWLTVDGNLLTFKNFDKHCTQTAKERAVTNKRIAKCRSKKKRNCNGDVTPEPLQKPLPENRREEKIQIHSHPPSASESPVLNGDDVREIPPWAHVLEFAARIGIAEWRVRDEYDKLESNGWKDGRGNPIKKWQPHFTRVKTWWESDGRPMTPPKKQPPGNSRNQYETARERDLRVTGTTFDRPLPLI